MSRLRPLLIVIVGLALGAGLGLYLGWVAWPTEFTDANPAVLQDVYRHDYVRLTAAAYTVDDNLSAAQKRVASLGDDGRDVVLAVTLDTILQGGDEAEIRQLVRLAAALGLESPAMVPYLPERAP
jgi:hypothetical protein